MAVAATPLRGCASDAPPAPGRLLRAADFQRVLGVAPRARSAHFSAHHLAACPSLPAKPRRRADAAAVAGVGLEAAAEAVVKPVSTELSTSGAPACPAPVDDLSPSGPPGDQPDGVRGQWLGLVVPKRHARRAVTRNLIKRQMRAVMRSAGAGLPAGLWVLRLKAPFDRQVFKSAASLALLRAARDELLLLLQRAAAPRR